MKKEDPIKIKQEALMGKKKSITKGRIDKLPKFFAEIAKRGFTDEDADMLLMSSIATVSAMLPNVKGVYDGREVYTNLYFFLSAPASSGKGRMGLAQLLAHGVHELKRTEYYAKVDAIKKSREENGEKVTAQDLSIPQKMLIIPGNVSATAIYQGLGDNEGEGLISETEADTLTNSLGAESGNFTDGLRKAFHHEPISYFRRKDNEYVEVKKTRLSVVLAGTPMQMVRLLGNIENGLFSRFIIMNMGTKLEWKDVFDRGRGDVSDDVVFMNLGTEMLRFYNQLKGLEWPVEVVLSDEQKARFNVKFERDQRVLYEMFGEDIVASVRRMGLIAFRIAMILTMMRIKDFAPFYIGERVECLDVDFDSALWISDVLMFHTMEAYGAIPHGAVVMEGLDVHEVMRDRLFGVLGDVFTRGEVLEAAEGIGVSRATADRYLRALRVAGDIEKVRKGVYCKCVPAEASSSDDLNLSADA